MTPPILEEIPVEQIRANDRNARVDMGDIEGLAKELKHLGVRSPLRVYAHPELEGDYLVQDGHRRLQAAKRAGLDKVPCWVVDAPSSAADDYFVQLSTGRHGKPATVREQAVMMQGLLELGTISEVTVAKRLSLPKKAIGALAKLETDQTTDDVRAMAASGRLDLLQVAQLQELQAEDEDLVAEVMSQIRFRGVRDQQELDREVERARARVERRRRDEALKEAGAQAIESGAMYSGRWQKVTPEPGVDGDDLEEATEEVVPEDTMSPEAHIAAGHKFSFDYSTGQPVWWGKTTTAGPDASEEEKAHKQRLRELSGGLGLAFRVRRQHLVNVVREPKPPVSLAADRDMLVELLWYKISKLDDEVLGEVIGVHKPEPLLEDDTPSWVTPEPVRLWQEKVRDKVGKMTLGQIIRLGFIAEHQDTDKRLRSAGNLDRSRYDWGTHHAWFTHLQTRLGYRLDEHERDALTYWEDRGGSYSTETITEGSNRDESLDVEVLK